ncbi:blast:Ecdysone-induced protein 75B%2C isoforms C/D, partial [Drosophila guanche]
MLMSADSSDCQPSSSAASMECPSTSTGAGAKTSVICLGKAPTTTTTTTAVTVVPTAATVNTTPTQQQQQSQTVAASSTTTSGSQLLVGRSHLENALKLPPNTSVSAYYQHNKLQQGLCPPHFPQDYTQHTATHLGRSLVAPVTDMDTVPPTGVAMASSSSTGTGNNSSKMPHSNVIYVSKSSSAAAVSTSEAQTVSHFESLPQHLHQHHQQQQQQQQQHQHLPQMASPMYHHHQPQGYAPANLHHPGGIVVVAADSRPQTPDYIKSYPVMDTTVASSVKGEPELNI